MTGLSMARPAILATSLFAIAFVTCCKMPARDRHDPANSGYGPGVLEGDCTISYLVTWGTGRSVRMDMERKGGASEITVTSEWLKSSLMPTRTWDLAADRATEDDLISIVGKMELEPLSPENMGVHDCLVGVTTADGSWVVGSDCPRMTGEPAFASLTGLLHPRWFSASHLLAAGMDAESQVDAVDVYGYYEDGLAVLGDGYGPIDGDITLDQVDRAKQATGEKRWVDAVVEARNALSARLGYYEKIRLGPLGIRSQ